MAALPDAVVLKSEFAVVQVKVDDTGNGPRLEVVDLRTGRAIFLDPLELESLAHLRHEDLTDFHDPGKTRWSGD